MAEWNKRTLKHIDYEEDKVKQWRGNETYASMHSGVFNYDDLIQIYFTPF